MEVAVEPGRGEDEQLRRRSGWFLAGHDLSDPIESIEIAHSSAPGGVIGRAEGDNWTGAVVGPSNGDNVDLVLGALLGVVDDGRADPADRPADRGRGGVACAEVTCELLEVGA